MRVAHPLHERAKAYLQLYEFKDANHQKLKQLRNAHAWARKALELREAAYSKQDSGQELILRSKMLLENLERNMKLAEANVFADHTTDPLFEGLCESPEAAINLQREVRWVQSAALFLPWCATRVCLAGRRAQLDGAGRAESSSRRPLWTFSASESCWCARCFRASASQSAPPEVRLSDARPSHAAT